MRRVARYLAGRLGDVVHARSDADHRARGWEVRRDQWGGRRYRLDVASWLDAQIDRAGTSMVHDPALPELSELSEMPEHVRAAVLRVDEAHDILRRQPVGTSDVLVRWGRFDGREVA